MRVLIVEDDEALAQTLHWMSELKGHAARACRTGEEALSAFFEFLPTMVLIDLHLPDMPGIEVCERIRASELGDQAKIWAHTAFDDNDLRAAKARCFDGWLIKGSDMRVLDTLL